MQEEVENRTVNLAITTTRLSARTIVTGIRMYLNHRNNVSRQKVVQGIHGKQSVKELIGQNQGVSRMPIGDASIREFERLFSQQANRQRTDFVVSSILAAAQTERLEQLVRQAVREELQNLRLAEVPQTLTPDTAVQLKELPGSLIHALEEL